MENLLLFPGNVIKITDFGFARSCYEEDGGAIIGTDGWVAPEVLRGLDNSWQVDIWALGYVRLEGH